MNAQNVRLSVVLGAALAIGCMKESKPPRQEVTALKPAATDSADAQAARPNWLSNIIDDYRKEYRWEIRQSNHIVDAIKRNPKGNELAAKGDSALKDAVNKGLQKADEVEKEIERTHVKTAQPSVQASWLICDVLGVPRPSVDDGSATSASGD